MGLTERIEALTPVGVAPALSALILSRRLVSVSPRPLRAILATDDDAVCVDDLCLPAEAREEREATQCRSRSGARRMRSQA